LPVSLHGQGNVDNYGQYFQKFNQQTTVAMTPGVVRKEHGHRAWRQGALKMASLGVNGTREYTFCQFLEIKY